MSTYHLRDLIPDFTDYGPIPQKQNLMSGVYMGKDRIMTSLWTGHNFITYGGDMIVTPHLINIGINEPHNTRVLASITRPGDVYVDVGANVGYFSVLGAWRAYGQNENGAVGQVWSFEPSPAIYSILCDNLTISGYGGMAQRRRVALSDNAGTAQLRIFKGYEATSTIRDVPDAFVVHTEQETGRESYLVDVDIVRLDDVMCDVPQINVMKIDAEGHEPSVIRGALEILKRSPTIKIVMEFVPTIMGIEESYDLLKTMRGLGFSIFKIEDDASVTRQDDDAALIGTTFSDLFLMREG
jgi:FkbM family methyltransferase